MDRNEIITYLKDCINAPGVTKKCKSLLRYIVRKSKRLTDDALLQFIELIGLYYDEINNNFINELENDANINNLPDDIKEMFNDIKNKYGDNFKIYEISNNRDHYQPEEKSNAKWIKRRSLLMNITNHNITINESFMDYLEEIRDAAFQSMMVMSSYDDQTDEIGVMLGTLDNDITLTMVGGVSEYETFYFSRNDRNLGVLDDYDFNYFNSQTKGKLVGQYVFQLDAKHHLFLGKKIAQ